MSNNFNYWQTQYSNIAPNNNNPYDQAGLKHNLLMATIEQRGSHDMSTSQVFEIVDGVIEENYVNSLNINNEAKQNLLTLADILLSYDVENLLTVITQIVDFENILINEFDRERNIYEPVLIASSIGRYSLCYWHERLLSNKIQDNRAPFWKKFFVALADVIGGVNGAIVGGATVVGGIVGGVTGAISSSVAFAKLWDIFAE